MRVLLVGCVALLGWGCGSSGGEDSGELAAAADAAVAAAADAGPSTPERFWREEPSERDYFDDQGFMSEGSLVNVVSRLVLQGVDDEGVALGFDLDGVTSEAGNDESCGHADLTNPAGEPGVDNQFAAVWNIIEPLVGTAVRELLGEAINEGRFLLVMELDGVDDLQNDDDVTLRLVRGQLTPKVGAAGYLLPNQTYSVDQDFPSSEVTGVAIVDGRVTAGPLQVTVPIEIFDANFPLRIQDGIVSLTIREDGSFEGVLGGTIDVQAAIQELLNTGAAAEAELVRPFFEDNADMGFDGETCQLLSIAVGFDTAPGFLVRYPGE